MAAELSVSCASDSVSASGKCDFTEGESSESDGETEPAKSFHRRISTNKEIKCSVSKTSCSFYSLFYFVKTNELVVFKIYFYYDFLRTKGL